MITQQLFNGLAWKTNKKNLVAEANSNKLLRSHHKMYATNANRNTSQKKKTLKNKKTKTPKTAQSQEKKIKIGEKILSLKNTHQELNAKNE